MKIMQAVTQAKDWVQPLDLNLRALQAMLLCLKIAYIGNTALTRKVQRLGSVVLTLEEQGLNLQLYPHKLP
jgi:hypothetical protein